MMDDRANQDNLLYLVVDCSLCQLVD
jgi:hypothetical protein